MLLRRFVLVSPLCLPCNAALVYCPFEPEKRIGFQQRLIHGHNRYTAQLVAQRSYRAAHGREHKAKFGDMLSREDPKLYFSHPFFKDTVADENHHNKICIWSALFAEQVHHYRCNFTF
eukprot:1415565-Amphidinium_carterae.1